MKLYLNFIKITHLSQKSPGHKLHVSNYWYAQDNFKHGKTNLLDFYVIKL